MNTLCRSLAVLSEYRRSYVVMNVVYYGLVLVAMGLVALNRDIQTQLLEAVQASVKEGVLAPVGRAYAGGVLPAIAVTFAVNFLVGSFASITLPSLVIPFSGLVVAAYRAVLWGLLFSPTTLNVTASEATGGALVALLILLEGQGYVLPMLAAYVHGKAWLWPASVGAASRWQGYKIGLCKSAWIYILIAITLAVAAVYEALIAIVILPQLA
jgi:hypothetical protein